MDQTNTLRAGAAQIDLEAYAGLDLSGYAGRQNPATGVHDAVFVRALALCDDSTLLLILVADALGFERPFVLETRAQIESALRAAHPENIGARSISILIAGTHTHSAPATMTLHGCGQVSEEWLQQCAQTLEKAALQAANNLQPARFAAGSANASNAVINRRQQPARDDANSAETPPPLDEEVGVWRIENLTGETIAGVVNFACHPVVMKEDNCEVSAEYPGALCQQLQSAWGGVTLFLTGAIGDINPARRGAWSDVQWTAEQIAQAAQSAWEGLTPQPNGFLQTASRECVLPLLPLPSRTELQKLQNQFSRELSDARQSGDEIVANIAATRLCWCERVLNHAGSTPGHAVEVQLARIADAVLVALPGEIFVELGLQIKAQLRAQGFENIFIAGFSNANPGYVPTREAYPIGGYEVDSAHHFYGHPACVVPEAGEMLVEIAGDLGRRLS